MIESEQKILVGGILKYHSQLERVDGFDHVIFPPVYHQVVCEVSNTLCQVFEEFLMIILPGGNICNLCVFLPLLAGRAGFPFPVSDYFYFLFIIFLLNSGKEAIQPMRWWLSAYLSFSTPSLQKFCSGHFFAQPAFIGWFNFWRLVYREEKSPLPLTDHPYTTKFPWPNF